MKKPIPIPDQKKLQEKLFKAYKPLLDLGIPEKELMKVLSSQKFWASNRKHQIEMVNALYEKYKKESENNEKEENNEASPGV